MILLLETCCLMNSVSSQRLGENPYKLQYKNTSTCLNLLLERCCLISFVSSQCLGENPHEVWYKDTSTCLTYLYRHQPKLILALDIAWTLL